jgi:hypothetical protein
LEQSRRLAAQNLASDIGGGLAVGAGSDPLYGAASCKICVELCAGKNSAVGLLRDKAFPNLLRWAAM